MSHPGDDRFTVTFQAEGRGAHPIVRLRRAIKLLLRSFGLRVIDIRPAGNNKAEDRHEPCRRKVTAHE